MVSIPNFGVEKLFSKLGRSLESSGRKFSTANEAYAYARDTNLAARFTRKLPHLLLRMCSIINKIYARDTNPPTIVLIPSCMLHKKSLGRRCCNAYNGGIISHL